MAATSKIKSLLTSPIKWPSKVKAVEIVDPTAEEITLARKIAHLDGLNLSRAWCWRTLAGAMSESDPAKTHAISAALNHLAAAIPHVSGDYMGEHWLATFALLALENG